MSFAPQTLLELKAFWEAHGGDELGIVGNTSHTQGYHLGRDRIYDGAGPGVGDADYSVKMARDKAGLTNAASAIDLGRLNGSLPQLRKFSNWLVAQCMANEVTRRDIREVIYSPDGVKVQRYSGVDNLIHTGAGNGDLSHLTHTHISYFRDSQSRDKVAVFVPYFGEDAVNVYPVPKVPSIGDVAKGTRLYVSSTLVENNSSTNGDILIDPGRSLPYHGDPATGVRQVEYVNESGVHSGKMYFVKAAALTNIRAVAAPPPDCTQAVKDATDPLNAQIAKLQQDVAKAELTGAQTEWDRQHAGATVSVTLLDRPS